MNQSLIQNSLALFEDAKWYLSQMYPEEYCLALPILSGASIGQHTRHFIEFYQCLVEQMKHPHRVLNYDLRKRDKLVETSPTHAMEVLENLAWELPQMPPNETILLESVDFETDSTAFIFSSPERELLYNIEHTIHHFALIKIGLMKIAPHLEIPSSFGVAPSTLRFRAGKMFAQSR